MINYIEDLRLFPSILLQSDRVDIMRFIIKNSITFLKISFLSTVYTFLRICRYFQKSSIYDVKCLMDKTAIITGGNAGIGYAAALHLASRGCKIIIADCMNAEKSVEEIKKITGNSKILFKYLDLSSLRNIRQFADDIKATEAKIDILINNAGIGATEKTATEDGLNYLMQINYFGSFLLTHLLLEPLKNAKSSNITFTTSISMYDHNLRIDNLNLTHHDWKDQILYLYSNSKLCNAIAAVQFAKKLEKYGITVNSFDPLGVKTSIFNNFFNFLSPFAFHVLLLKIALAIFAQTPLEAAETLLHLVANEETSRKTGGNYSFCLPMLRPSIVFNQRFTDEVWGKTEELVKLAPEERIR